MKQRNYVLIAAVFISQTVTAQWFKKAKPAQARAHSENHRNLSESHRGTPLLPPGGDGRDREERLQPEYLSLYQHSGERRGD